MLGSCHLYSLTIADANEMRDAESTKKILDTLDSQGLVAFDFVFAGNRHVLLNDGFVQSPADLKREKTAYCW